MPQSTQFRFPSRIASGGGFFTLVLAIIAVVSVTRFVFPSWSSLALSSSTRAPLQRWPALAYDNVVNVPEAPKYEHRSPKGVPISVVMPVYNQEAAIPDVIKALLSKTTGPFELIVVYDGCTDNSREALRRVIDAYKVEHSLRSNKRDGLGLIGFTELYNAESQYETRSNNKGFLAVQTEYAVIVQDDMLMVKPGWDRHLLRPALGYSDVLGVTARCAHNLKWGTGNDRPEFPDQAGDCGGHHYDIESGDTFYVRDSGNRGPLLLEMSKLRQLNYLADEFYPQETDEHDLCLRAYQQFGWVCGVAPVSVHSTQRTHRNDGATRPIILQSAERHSYDLLLSRHANYLQTVDKHNQDRRFSLTD